MQKIITILLMLLGVSVYGQDKYNYVHFNKLTPVEGTDYVIARIENMGKMYAVHSTFLLFINARNGQSKQVDFPPDASIHEIEQVRVDSLQINKIILEAKTLNLDKNKSIDWNDPSQIIVLSPDGQEKTQLTEDKFFVSTWVINRTTGSIVITGYYDSNNNGQYDKKDKNEIVIYDLKTLKLIAKI